LNIGDSVLLLLPTENNKLTLAWRVPYEVVEKVSAVDCKIRVTPDKINTYHINMLKKYHQRKEQRIENDKESENINESEESKGGRRIEQVAAIACVIDDGITENSEFEIEDDKQSVVKLSRNVVEQRSGTFLKASTVFRDFYTGQRRNATLENGTYFSTAFRQMAVIVNHHAPAER